MSKEITVIQSSKRQSFTEEEKRRIVQESHASSSSLNRFAKSRGISPATLCIWRRQFKTEPTTEIVSNQKSCMDAFPYPAELGNLQNENQILKQENGKLKEQLFKMRAFVGQKVFELEAMSYA